MSRRSRGLSAHPRINARRYYTGIGSRVAPEWAKAVAAEIAKYLALGGVVLRSGGAAGMDEAFELTLLKGVRDAKSLMEIWSPWRGFRENEHPDIGHHWIQSPGQRIESLNFLEQHRIVRSPHGLPKGIKELFARNVFQITGAYSPIGDSPIFSEFVVYWAPEEDGIIEGGTRVAVYVARQFGVDTYNLALEDERKALLNRLGLMHLEELVDDWESAVALYS